MIMAAPSPAIPPARQWRLPGTLFGYFRLQIQHARIYREKICEKWNAHS
jgi:hypothetical protein